MSSISAMYLFASASVFAPFIGYRIEKQKVLIMCKKIEKQLINHMHFIVTAIPSHDFMPK